jgi:hypothetical protein
MSIRYIAKFIPRILIKQIKFCGIFEILFKRMIIN